MLPRLQRRGHSLNVAEVVGPKGVVVTSAERGPRLDHFRHATRIRHRKTLAPVIDERLLLTAGPANHCARLVNHVNQLVREATGGVTEGVGS